MKEIFKLKSDFSLGKPHTVQLKYMLKIGKGFQCNISETLMKAP